jgi:hypothetical protein
VNEAILLALSNESFLLYCRYPAGYAFQKHWISSACQFSAFHSQVSSFGSLQALWQSEGKTKQNKTRQIELNRVELSIRFRDFLLSIWHQGYGYRYIVTFGESWNHGSTCRQIMR